MATATYDRRKAVAAERSAVWVRLAVVALGTYVYVFTMDRQGHVPPLAYVPIGVAWLYGLSVPVLQPFLRLPKVLSSYFTSIADAMFTMLWLFATGGFDSPFYVAIYAAVVSVALRFNIRETAVAALVYAASYIMLLAGLRQLAAHWVDVLIRVGFIFVVAATGALLVRETFRQVYARTRMRARLLRELRSREERYRVLFENVPVGLYRTTPEGRFLDANAALLDLLGYPDRESLLATAVPRLYVDLSAWTARKGRMEERGLVRDFTVQLRRADGSVIWVTDSGRAVRDERGQVVAYEGMLEDITARRQAEEELQRNEARLRRLVDQIPALIWTTDRQLRFTSFLGAGLAVLGVQPNQFVGASLHAAFGRGDPDRPPIAPHKGALAGRAEAFEFRWGGRIYQAHVEPLRGGDGSITGTTGVAVDITERMRADEIRSAFEAARRPAGGSLTG